MSDIHHTLNDYEVDGDSVSNIIVESDLKQYNIDSLINLAGGFGKMQWCIMFFAFTSNQSANYFPENFAYLELVPSMLCKYHQNDQFVKCHDFKDICTRDKVYEWKVDYSDPYSFHNWMTDHELYCKSDFAIGMFGSMYFIGFGFMGLLLKFGDVFGRKKIIFIGCLLHMCLLVAIYLTTDYRSYYVMCFFCGLFYAKETMIYVYALEIVPDKYQVYVAGYMISVVTVICHVNESLYFYFGGKSWKIGFAPSLVLTFLSISLCFLIPESPRYLYSKKDWSGLQQNLNTIATFNGIDTFRHRDDYSLNKREKRLLTSEDGTTSANSSRNPQEYSVLAALRDKKTFINLVVIVTCFSIVSFNYFLVGFYLKYLGGSIYMNTLASAMSDLIGNFGVCYIQKLFGTKKSIFMCFALSAVFAVPLLFVTQSYQIAICVFLSKVVCEGAFCLSYFLSSEYFDPLFVPFSLSMCSFGARFIATTAPQIAELKPRQIPIIVYLGISSIAAVSALFLVKPKKNEASQISIQNDY